MAQQTLNATAGGPDDNLPTATAKLNSMFNELYALQSRTVNAADPRFAGATDEISINNAINMPSIGAVAIGADRVRIPTSMTPFDASLVTSNVAVQQVVEGGDDSEWNLLAYGADRIGVVAADAAFVAAIAGAAAQGSAGGALGATVKAPSGLYRLLTQQVLPQGVIFKGDGRSATVLLADALFPPSTFMIVIGAGAETTTFGTRLENLTVHCNDVAGSCGISSTKANEQSGLQNVQIYQFRGTGVQFSTGNCQNWFMDDCEITFSASAGASAVGLDVDSTGDIRGLDNLTINAIGAVGIGATGIRLDGTGFYSRVHIEKMADGILIGSRRAVSGVTLAGITGSPTNTTLVRISNAFASQNITACGMVKRSGTNILKDDILGNTITDTDLGVYALGNGSPPSLVTTAAVLQRTNASLILQNTLQAGQRVLDGKVALTWGAAIALDASTGNYFTLNANTNIAGTVSAPSNAPGTNLSQVISVEFLNTSGGALSTPIAFNAAFLATGTVSPGNNLSIEVTFRYNNSRGKWIELSRTSTAV